MNIIFDNIIFSLQKSGGGSVYWSELIKRFNNLCSEEVVFYDHLKNNQNIFRKEICLKNSKLETFLILKIRRYLNFTKSIKNKTIFHSSYFRISKSKHAINVTTIHDFTTEKFRKGIAKRVNLMQKKYALKNSAGVICISENTKKDLLYYFPDIDKTKIRVIYNGVSDDFYKINENFNISKQDDRFINIQNYKYLLYIGHRTNYKNFPIAVDLASRFINKYKLVVVGEPFNKQEISMINKKLGNNYVILSGIDNQKLNALYNKAFALIYPSSYEGFGIPIVEAMKSNCPVVASQNSSITEVAGHGAILCKDVDVDLYEDALYKLENLDYRNELILRGVNQSLKFNWDDTFKKYYSFYKELYNNH